MAEVIYYYISRSGAGWAAADFMVDKNLGTSAYTSSDGTQELCDDNECDGTDLGTITKVEHGCNAQGDGDDKINLRYDFADKLVTPDTSPSWKFVDITDQEVSWNWGLIRDARCRAIYEKSGKANRMDCYATVIKVTYTPTGAKTTQYLAGVDCPEFPHEQDIQSDKLPCPLPY